MARPVARSLSQPEAVLSAATAAAPVIAPVFATPAITAPATTSKVFVAMAATYAAMNALDIYTTTKALRSGAGIEANPLVGPVAGSPVALTILKAASTTSTIFLARRMWKQHPKGAIALLVIANVGMGVVVSHNASVAGGF
jgi:hypothetical protein